MKQIVPFTKTIDLKTNIEEVTSISLDRIVKDISDSEITGEFELYLEYKENDISVNTLNFTSTIPFNINLDDRYSAKNSKVDIDDFYYEIEDSDITLHIDLLIDKLDLVDKELENIIPIKEERVEDGKVEEEKTEEIEKEIDVVREEIEEDRNDKIEDLFKQVDENVSLEVKDKPKINPIFETFDEENDAFVTYNVHIVREDDNIDSICAKYSVTKEEVAYYNEIKEIKMGDKLIIPTYKK